MAKASATFNGLTAELKGLIIDRVLRPSDLKNVCLTSKELHIIAVRRLYEHVALDLGSPNDKRLSAFLNPRNIGLKHIKQIRLYVARVRDKCNQDQQTQLMCRMLLEFLPEDVLEEFRCDDSRFGVEPTEYDPYGHFASSGQGLRYADYVSCSWCPWSPFSADNLLLLYKRQKKIKWLEAMDLDRDVLSDLKKDDKVQESMFKEARNLALYPENRTTLQLAGFYVTKMKDRLEELILHAQFFDNDRGSSSPTRHDIQVRELNDSATAPGLLTSTIFSSFMPFDQCEPFKKLTTVRLHRVNLRFCADTWCKIVNFQQVEELRVYSCTGSDSLLAQLSKAAHLPRKLRVLELCHKDNSENEALLALDGFLCLVSGIRELVIDLDQVKGLPAAIGITSHRETLRILSVHGSNDYNLTTSRSSAALDDGEQLVWDVEEFTKICDACTHLEQLSCAWPATSLIRAPSDAWFAFAQQCRSLKKLVTLHTTTWPSNKPSTQLLPRSIYEDLLQRLASRTFSLFLKGHEYDSATGAKLETTDAQDRAGRLRLIAFGVNDKSFDREDSPNQIIYLRSTCQDAEGKTWPHATPISWCLRRYVEGRSDVLDLSLMDRGVRPPCRESGVAPAGLSWGGGDDDDDI